MMNKHSASKQAKEYLIIGNSFRDDPTENLRKNLLK